MTGPATIGTEADCTISVVIPNLDGARWLEGCLATLRSGTDQPFEIIVSDDGSTDQSRWICERHRASFIGAPRRCTGFAATANRGIAGASGAWILLLNNDTEVTPTTIKALTEAIRRHPDSAMIAPLVLSLRDRETVDSAGMLVFPDATARPRWHGARVDPAGLHDEPILLPSGAAALVQREWLEGVGRLDESLGSYLEDIDMGLRIRRAGGSGFFVPSAVVFHHFSGTTGALSPFKARLIERNHTIVAVRHLPLRWLIALPFWTIARWCVLTRTVLGTRGAALDGGGSAGTVCATAFAVVRGGIAGILHAPSALRERKRLNAAAVVGAAEWRRLLQTHRARISDYHRFGAEAPAPSD